MTDFAPGSPTYWLAIAVGVFCVKHFLGDFVLQTGWMTRGKEAESGWIIPLTAHAGVHAMMTGLIFLTLSAKIALVAAAIDLLIHGVIDRLKAVATRRLGMTQSNPVFWWLFGGDQMLHHLTHLGFSVYIASAI